MVDERTPAEVLARFSAPAREWFTSAFAAPTTAQTGAWDAISSGHHTLVVAPTGSGKTLSAFLWAIDRLSTTEPPEDPRHRCRVLYVSPLKALASDVERNLRAPLAGLAQAGARVGETVRPVSVAMRSGDTPASERRAFTTRPPDVLITTPESLFLILTSRAREQLAGVETVILDEVHAVAGTKRGAHLALSLERLDALLEQPAQRIGLSATVRPVEEVARFLAGQREPGADGGRPVTVVQPPSEKKWDLSVVVPVEDMTELGQPATTADGSPDLSGNAAGAPATQSIWPHVEERVVDLVAPVEGQPARSSLVFTNSRRLAERLTARLNETWAARLAALEPADDEPHPDGTPRTPAEVMAQSGASTGAPAVLARAHHGSVSKEQRALIEDDLKSGRLPTVVATSSLELGIDMGAVDLVVQVESPPSVSSGLQRVGRAGHQVGAVSRGVMFPKFRADLVTMAVITERMRSAQIEALRVPANPLDVLAQHVVAMTALDDWDVDELHALVRRAAPFGTLSRPVLESVLDMLSGRYPSEEFAELRPRVVWDRIAGTLTGRPGAQRLAVTSGGTIPDRGLYGVFLATGTDKAAGSTKQGGRRVGELDEEMVYESRVGDVFTLGASTWRIEDITHDQVLVTPAPGQPGRLPFWHGDQIGRPLELGRAVGEFVRELDALTDEQARARLTTGGLDPWASDNLIGYLREQREATGHVPDDRTIVVERFRDELGDWRVVVHSPFGAQVHGPWALAMSAAMRDLHGLDVQAMPADDGIVLRMPDFDAGPWEAAEHPTPIDPDASHHGSAPEVLEALLLDPGSVQQRVTDQLGGSALFAARFRECAARALLLPRRRPDRRQPLWQQRQRAASLLEVAVALPDLPDRARDRARVPAGRVRRAGPRGRAAVAGVRRDPRRRGHHRAAVAVRALPAVRLRGPVPLRGRLAAGRAPGRRAGARPRPAGRAARRRRLGHPAGRPARPRAGGAHPPRAAAAGRGPAGPVDGGGRRPAARARAAVARRAGRAHHRIGRRRRRVGRRARHRAPGHHGDDRRDRAGGGRRGRRPAARRPRHPPAGRAAAGLHRGRRRPARPAARPVRPHPRPVHRPGPGPPVRARCRGGRPGARPARSTAAGSSSASCCPIPPAPCSRTTPRRSASSATPR